MSRYIDADKLRERLDLVSVDAITLYEMGINAGLHRAEAEIEMQPTADVVEVRHGYWETVTELKNDTVCGNGRYIQYKICSICKHPMGVTDNIYCGHCGTKMDGGRNEG